MKRWILTLIIIFSATGAAAQTCGYGLPCGPVRWRLPNLPELQSPTPVSTVFLSQTPSPGPTATGTITPASATPTFTPTPTPTPTATATSGLDTSGINNAVETLQGVMAATQAPVFNELGTPVDNDAIYAELGTNAGTFFGYARGIVEFNFGSLTPIFTFLFLAFVVVLSVRILIFTLPVFAALLGFIRKLVDIVLQFIPL